MFKIEVRYMAGLFDGEGYIRIVKFQPPGTNHIRYALFGGINMCHQPVIEAIHKRYGGFYGGTQYNPKYPNTRVQFGVTWGSQQAATLLRTIQKHTFVKREEIDLALEFQHHIDSNPYKPTGKRGVFRENRAELLAVREDMYRRMTALKKKTFPAVTLRKPQQSPSEGDQ